MSISRRITLLIALTFLAITAIGGFAVFQSRGSATDVKTVTQGVVPSALASAELVGQLKDVQLSVMTIVAAPDLQLAALAEDRLQTTQARLQKAFDQQLEQADSHAQRGLVNQAKENLANYFTSIKEAVTFKLAGNMEMAEAVLSANVAGYLQEMESVIETLQIEKRRAKDEAIVSLNDNLTATSSTLAGVTLVAVLVLSAIGLLLYRQIIHPIRDMEIKMMDIATSQDYTHRLSVSRMDEIGHSVMAFNMMIEKIQETAALVKQKNADIHAMLHAIPQGILTIQQGNTIHPDYSVQLERILQTQDIAGRDLIQTVFANTSCSSDLLSQVETTCAACVGEDAMNFEFNAHLLPTEVTRTFADGVTKILDLNWSPISDESGITVRLLVCVRDVTELRALAAQANDQKRELAIIGEILAVPQEKFHAFLQGARGFVQENRAILESTRPAPAAIAREATITELFRNMHTIKGNARTYGLLRLTHVVHDAEQAYDQLRKNAQLDWSCDDLLAQLDQVASAVEEYSRISESKLGRKGPGRRGGAERFLMVEKTDLDEAKRLLDSTDGSSPAALRDALRQVRHSLELIGTSRLAEILSGVMESLPSLAHELGKESPHCVIEDNAIAVRNQAVDMLRNVYMHLYRNALDHGLEQGAIRMAQGKAAMGTIRLTAAVRADQLVLSLQDDGRGLALKSIRERAVQNGLIGADDDLSDTQAAQLIFKPGFSTAQQVTEVSGRGVGMDAVRGFLGAAGGTIELQLLGDATTGGYRAFATVIRLPASLAVAPVLHVLQNVA